MFTGIIDHCGKITAIHDLGVSRQVWIASNFAGYELGESIAINGICVTVAAIDGPKFRCDLSPETLRITHASQFEVNQMINLERALLPTSKLGGHNVSGHVDQTAIVKTIKPINDFVEMTFSGLDKTAKKYVIKKGSIAVNGVSLTINEVTPDGFSVMLIPHTLERSNLAMLQENDAVNLEFDMMARIIIQQCEQYFASLQAG